MADGESPPPARRVRRRFRPRRRQRTSPLLVVLGLAAGVLVLLAVVGIGALVWSGGLSGLSRSKAAQVANPEVHRGNYEKVHAGMTLAEVEEILGPGERVGTKDLPQDDEFSIRGIREYANDYRATRFYRWRNGPNEIYVGLGLSRTRREVVVLHAFYFEIAARGRGSRGRELDGGPADSFE